MKKRNLLLATALLSVGGVFAQTLPDGMTALLPVWSNAQYYAR